MEKKILDIEKTLNMKESLTRIIIPFEYNHILFKEHDAEFKDIWRSSIQTLILDKFVQPHAKEFLLNSGELRVFSLNQKARKNFGLPHSNHHTLEIRRRKSDNVYPFYLKNVELFLFDEIGFISLYIQTKSDSIDDLAFINQFIKRALSGMSSETIKYERKISKDEALSLEIDLKSTIHEIIENTFTVSTIYDTYIYTSALLDICNEDESFESMLNKAFSSLIRTSGHFSTINGHSGGIVSFESNRYWNISLEGTVCLCNLESDNRVNPFIENSLFPQAQNTDFHFMLLSLYQRLYLMKFYSVASMVDANQESVLDIEKRLAIFKLKACFSQISNIMSIQSFYEKFRNVFRVEQIVSEIYREIQDLSTLVRQQIDKEEQEKRENDQKWNQTISYIILAITTIFVMISTSNDGWGFANLIDQPAVPDRPLAYNIFLGILIGTWGVVPILATVLGFIMFRRAQKNKKR